jgi:hypothetical protein
LYKVDWEELCTIDEKTIYLTDNFIITPDENPDGIRPKDTAGPNSEWALLARLIDNKGTKSIPYFVCAGHTADGTAVACNYLAENWSALCSVNRERLKGEHMALIVTGFIYIGLVGTVALVGGLQIWAAALVQLRCIGLHPAPDAAGSTSTPRSAKSSATCS